MKFRQPREKNQNLFAWQPVSDTVRRERAISLRAVSHVSRCDAGFIARSFMLRFNSPRILFRRATAGVLEYSAGDRTIKISAEKRTSDGVSSTRDK